jgi:methyltransferase (TIGR00027 family)
MLTASDTAYAIATVRALEGDRAPEQRLFDDPYARIFRDAGAHAAEATRRFIELPNMSEGVRLRTRFLDDLVRDALGAGLRQIVIMGAGFDARSLRLPEVVDHGARVYEIDFATLLDHKRSLLRAAGVKVPAHVAYVPCDFMDAGFVPALSAALEANGFRRAEGALFVWEGVIAYIDDPAIERSLTFMADNGAEGSRLGFDYADLRFDPVPAEDRVRKAGFSRFEAVGVDALWRRHLGGEPHPLTVHFKMGVATK